MVAEMFLIVDICQAPAKQAQLCALEWHLGGMHDLSQGHKIWHFFSEATHSKMKRRHGQ